MAEKLSLELELLDKVGGPAKKAAAALRGVETQAKKAQGALDFSKELGRTKAQLDKIKMDPKGFHDLIKAQKSLRDEREKLKKSMEGGHGGFFGSLKSGIKEHLGLNGLGGKMASASFWGHIGASAVVGIGEGFLEGAHKAVEILYDGIKEAFGAIAKEQERVAGYDLTLGKTESKEAREQIEHWSPKTAFSASQNQDMFLPLLRAGLKGKAATTAYASALDLAAARGKGADQGAVSEAVELFARIQRKGGITSKQLSGIGLGEKNVPAFFKDLGKQLHMSAESAKKLAADGKINPQIISNAITDAINKQQGGKAGTGGEVAGKGLMGQWNKLKSLPEEFFNKLVNSPALPKLSKALGEILEKFDPNGPNGKKILESLEKAFTKVADFLSDTITPENIDAVIEGLSKLPHYLEIVWKWSKDIAFVWAGMKVISTVNSVGSVVGKQALGTSLAKKAAGGVLASPVGAAAALGLGLAYAVDKQQEQVQATIDKFKEDHPVDKGAAEYFGTEYARQHKAVMRRGEMQIVQNISVGGINVDAASDPTHTGQKAGVAIAGGMGKELERARAEAGAR